MKLFLQIFLLCVGIMLGNTAWGQTYPESENYTAIPAYNSFIESNELLFSCGLNSGDAIGFKIQFKSSSNLCWRNADNFEIREGSITGTIVATPAFSGSLGNYGCSGTALSSQYILNFPSGTKDYYVKVIKHDGNTYTAGPITVTRKGAANFVNITSPAGGENWVRGTTKTITWNTNIVSGLNVVIRKGGTAIGSVENGVTGGSCNWTVTSNLGDDADYNIIIKDVNNNVLATSNYFTISAAAPSNNAPTITKQSIPPSAVVGSTITVRYLYTDPDNDQPHANYKLLRYHFAGDIDRQTVMTPLGSNYSGGVVYEATLTMPNNAGITDVWVDFRDTNGAEATGDQMQRFQINVVDLQAPTLGNSPMPDATFAPTANSFTFNWNKQNADGVADYDLKIRKFLTGDPNPELSPFVHTWNVGDLDTYTLSAANLAAQNLSIEEGYSYRWVVIAKHRVYPNFTKESNSRLFNISSPLAITSPANGAVLTTGAGLEVTWSSINPISNIGFRYKKENGDWIDWGASPSSNNKMVFPLPYAPNPNAVLQLYDMANPSTKSEVNFQIVKPEAGITIIVHGFSGDESFPSWTMEMAQAIKNRAGGGSIYQYDPLTFQWVKKFGTGNYNEEIILVYDWAATSNNFANGWAEAAGDKLFASLFADNIIPVPYLNSHLITDKKKHFICHSRGNIVALHAFRRIQQHFPSAKIEHYTALDPHPAEADLRYAINSLAILTGNASLAATVGVLTDQEKDALRMNDQLAPFVVVSSDASMHYEIKLPPNVQYADNYFRRDNLYEGQNPEFDGVQFYNNLQNSFELDNDRLNGNGFLLLSGGNHSDVHLWYYGTINMAYAIYSGLTVQNQLYDDQMFINHLSIGNNTNKRHVLGYNKSRAGRGSIANDLLVINKYNTNSEKKSDLYLSNGNFTYKNSGLAGAGIPNWSGEVSDRTLIANNANSHLTHTPTYIPLKDINGKTTSHLAVEFEVNIPSGTSINQTPEIELIAEFIPVGSSIPDYVYPIKKPYKIPQKEVFEFPVPANLLGTVRQIRLSAKHNMLIGSSATLKMATVYWTGYPAVVTASKTGNDSNNGITSPKRTIQAAVDATPVGGKVVIKEGNYNEKVVVKKDLTIECENKPSITSLILDFFGLGGGRVEGTSPNVRIINSPLVINESLIVKQGELTTNGNIILASDANNTAMAIEGTNGFITGNVTQQRHLTGKDDAHKGLGYTYISSPIKNANINGVLSPVMPLICNPAYNSTANPAFTNPFPNIFIYDESKAGFPKGTAPNQYDAFMVGWQVPNCSDNMEIMRGYSVNLPKGQVLEFVGELNSGEFSIPLTRGGTGLDRGFYLAGNPYPSPIDWYLVNSLSTNIDDAVYLRIATGQYSGTWASSVNGIGINGASDNIGIGQGFLVRCSSPTGGVLRMNNTIRAVSYLNPSFFRLEGRPNHKQGLVKLALKGNNQADETAIYFEKDATASFDSKFDAFKVQTNAGVTLYTKIGEQKISINGQADFEEKTEIPLSFYVPKNGNYTFSVSELAFFAPKSLIYLEDKLTKKIIDLQENPNYTFAANVGTHENRFVLRFSKPLPDLETENIILYPNPTAEDLKIRFLNNYEGAVKIKVLDLQGKVLQTLETQKGKGIFEQNLKVTDLSNGLYLLDIQTDTQKIVKKFVKQ